MEKGFWAVPKSIARRKDLCPRTKLVAGILWTRKDPQFKAFPSRRYIALALGVSVKTVDRAIKELKTKAGLKVKRKGLGKNNRYYLPNWDSKFPKSRDSDSSTLSTKKPTHMPTPIVRDNSKDNTVVEEKPSSIKEIFSYFRSKVRKTKGFDPEISWAKDGRLIKLRLKKYSLDQIEELIDWYLASNLSEKLGVSLATCLSTYVFNLWKAQVTSHPSYPLWKPPKT